MQAKAPHPTVKPRQNRLVWGSLNWGPGPSCGSVQTAGIHRTMRGHLPAFLALVSAACRDRDGRSGTPKRKQQQSTGLGHDSELIEGQRPLAFEHARAMAWVHELERAAVRIAWKAIPRVDVVDPRNVAIRVHMGLGVVAMARHVRPCLRRQGQLDCGDLDLALERNVLFGSASCPRCCAPNRPRAVRAREYASTVDD